MSQVEADAITDMFIDMLMPIGPVGEAWLHRAGLLGGVDQVAVAWVR